MSCRSRVLHIACDHERVFRFDTGKTALLIIDMQRDFIDPKGMAALSGNCLSAVRAIVPRVAQALQWARGRGLMVVHTREGHKPDLSDLHPAKLQRSVAAGEEIGSPGPLGRVLIRGERGHDFVDELRPDPGETVIDKPGFGAFYATSLQDCLRMRGITHLILTGVTTQCCVFSTLREAVDRGYWCLTLRDCTAAFDHDWHDATFRMIASEGHLFGWISDLTRILIAEPQSSA